MNRKQYKHSYTKFPFIQENLFYEPPALIATVVATKVVVGPSLNGVVTSGGSSLPAFSYLNPFGYNETDFWPLINRVILRKYLVF